MRRLWLRIRRPLLIGSLATGTVLGFGSGFASLRHWQGMHRDGHGCPGARWRGERPDAPRRADDGDADRR